MSTNKIDQFIEEHLHSTIPEISLALSKKKGWPKEYILNQINGRQKTTKKLPFLLQFPNFEFSSPRALAQASSEATAKYKANLISGNNMADLSGGMGIDSYFFAQKVDEMSYVEPNKDLFNQTTKNFKTLGVNNIKAFNTAAETFLTTATNFDFLYLDPDRRSDEQRFFRLEVCQPNVLELLPLLYQKAKIILLKLSPLFDIKMGIKQLKGTSEIHVVAVKNDCKEVLFLLQKDYNGEIKMKCSNLNNEKTQFYQFDLAQESQLKPPYSAPLNYLYEPNVAISKAGAFNSIAKDFKLNKLAINTHLYTSTELVEDFPGRILVIEKVGKANDFKNIAANVVVKNFPSKTAEIRKEVGS